MRSLVVLFLSALSVSAAAGPIETVQQLFDCIAKHDADGARKLFFPGATLVSGAVDGPFKSTSAEDWLKRLGEAKGEWRETITGKPTVLEDHGMAAVWTAYQFHVDGKLSHCGIDLLNLVKTAEGWRVSSVAYTRQTTGCEIH